MSALSDTEKLVILDALLAGRYLALHSADPTDVTAVASANELTEGGYSRLLCAFDAASGDSAANTDLETYTASGENWPEATHWSLWSAVTGGTMKAHGAFNTPKTALAGDSLTVAAGAIVVTAA